MILHNQGLRSADDARRLPGWVVVYVMFGQVRAETCDTGESADRVASEWQAHGLACTVLHDGAPTS